jgi:hypothetical protein
MSRDKERVEELKTEA